METHIKEIVKTINGMSGKHDKYTIFRDLIAMGALSIRSTVEPHNIKKIDEEYFKVIDKYNKKELDKFADILAKLTIALDKKPYDVLGQVFMELEISNKWTGQFFTTMDISEMIAQITFNDMDKIIEEKGFIALDEPAVGGGAMIIALADIMKRKGYNYQKQLYVNARDLDLRAVQMCYIQLSLLGIPANVQHGNTITLDIFDEWETPFFVLGNWKHKLRRKKKNTVQINEDDSGQLTIA